jgi:hypothetical protein
MCCGSSPASRRPMAVSARRLMVRARDRRNPAGQISVALGRIGMGDRRLSLCGIDPACAGRGVGASVAAGIRRLERHQDQRKRRGGRRPALIHEWRTTESSPFSSGRCSAFFDRLVRRRPAVAVTGTCLVRSRGLRKDGKEHRYWSIVESRHCAGGRVAQRPVLHLGVMTMRSLKRVDGIAPLLPSSRKGTSWQHILQTLACYRLIDSGSEWRLRRCRCRPLASSNASIW